MQICLNYSGNNVKVITIPVYDQRKQLVPSLSFMDLEFHPTNEEQPKPDVARLSPEVVEAIVKQAARFGIVAPEREFVAMTEDDENEISEAVGNAFATVSAQETAWHKEASDRGFIQDAHAVCQCDQRSFAGHDLRCGYVREVTHETTQPAEVS